MNRFSKYLLSVFSFSLHCVPLFYSLIHLTHTYQGHFRGNEGDKYDIVLDFLKEGINIDENYTKLIWGEMDNHRVNGKMNTEDYKNSRILSLYRKLKYVYI